MSALDSRSGWIANATLYGVTLIPLVGFWALSLRGRGGQQSQPVKLAVLFLRIALPVSIIAVALAVVGPSILAAPSPSTGALLAALYTLLTASFLANAASILTTLAVYLTGICALYVVLGKQKWWRLLRIDALSGSVLFFVVDIAWFAKNIGDIQRGDAEGYSIYWLIVLLDIALSLLTAGVVGVAIYATPKLKKRTHLAVGNLSVLLLSASFLWLFRCIYVLSIDIKNSTRDWTADELSVQKVISPILDCWVSAGVLGLVTIILRHPVWFDPTAIPDRAPEHPPQVFVQYPGYYPHPQYGYQQQPPQMHQQYYPPPQGMHQQQPHEPSPTLVPATRMHEAAATQPPVELQGANKSS